jgi:predicted Zn-dependent protease
MSKFSMHAARALAVACTLIAMRPPVLAAQTDALGRAMRDELARSVKELRLDQLERPYFIAYRVHDMQTLGVSASNGSLLASNEYHARSFTPEVRVGDYAFDNTNFSEFGGGGLIAIGMGPASGMGFYPGSLPLDDNYLEFRRHMWLMTDATYKEAAEAIARKRAALLNRARRDTLPDFSRATPTTTTDEMPAITWNRADGEALVRALSALPELARFERSSVSMTAGNVNIRLLNSEGTATVSSRPLVSVSASVSTQATDGEPLSIALHAYSRTMPTTASREQLVAALRIVALRLDSLRTAPVLERYSGPVLVDGRAAAELFAETFAPALLGHRPQDGQPDFTAMLAGSGRQVANFTDKIGSRVLPTFLSVIDDPTISELGGQPLFGSYRADDDGVPAQRKTLVDNGTMKRVLTTRVPVQGGLQSTGNRRGEGAAPSNLIVTSANGVTDAELKSRLLALVKQRGLEYGVILRELGGRGLVPDDPMSYFSAMRNQSAGRRVLFAYRVYPDGREQLVRSARLTDATAQSFKDVLAVSSTPTLYHRAAIGGGFPFPIELMDLGDAGGSLPLASYVVPSMLFEDLTLTRDTGERPKPPLSSPPGSASR